MTAADGKPTNPRFVWPEEVRQAQREAMAAVDKLVRVKLVAEQAAGKWDDWYQDKPGTVLDDVDESMITGFVVFAQYQFMVGDPEDSRAFEAGSGTLTGAAESGLIHYFAKAKT